MIRADSHFTWVNRMKTRWRLNRYSSQVFTQTGSAHPTDNVYFQHGVNAVNHVGHKQTTSREDTTVFMTEARHCHNGALSANSSWLAGFLRVIIVLRTFKLMPWMGSTSHEVRANTCVINYIKLTTIRYFVVVAHPVSFWWCSITMKNV